VIVVPVVVVFLETGGVVLETEYERRDLINREGCDLVDRGRSEAFSFHGLQLDHVTRGNVFVPTRAIPNGHVASLAEPDLLELHRLHCVHFLDSTVQTSYPYSRAKSVIS